MITVIVAYSVINFIIQSVIQPYFVGDSVGLGITTTFHALIFWAWLLGPLGALLAERYGWRVTYSAVGLIALRSCY